MQRGGLYPQLELDAFVRAAAEAIRLTALEFRATHGAHAQQQDTAAAAAATTAAASHQLQEQLLAATSECARLQALIDRAAAAGFILGDLT